MNKMRKLYALFILIFFCTIISYPTVKAKFTKSEQYSFSVITKALPSENTAFSYTGGLQEFNITKEGYYIMQVWGANGGNSSNGYAGGSGDYFIGMGYFTEGKKLYIAIGGAGKNGSGPTGGTGGYNGGGNGGNAGWFSSNSGGGGGGATSIFLEDTALNNRILVAGGGGGAGAGGNNSLTVGGNVSSDDFRFSSSGTYVGNFREGLSGVGDSNIIGGWFSGGGGSLVGGDISYQNDISLSLGQRGTEGNGGNAGSWAGGGGGGLYGGAGGSSTNAISGGGGAGSSFYSDFIETNLSSSVIDRLPGNQDFLDQSYKSGYGYAIVSYFGKKLPKIE